MPNTQKRRIDVLLVELGLADSRQRAQALVMAGQVTVNGRTINKAGSLVPPESSITITSATQYVGRGGIKLAHALDQFQIAAAGLAALDVGASTGGFTDCLLQRGARHVYALDVGYGQLDYGLRNDPRVTIFERLNARYPFSLPEQVDIITVDVSFISLEVVLPSLATHVKQLGNIVALVKPQFEAQRQQVGKGGIIRDPRIHAQVLAKIIRFAVTNNYRLRGLTTSPILGDARNQEFFVWLTPAATS
ncbi:MAG: TlyA family rRNA (cytidine-2'-O)-methyltransferase [SAR202 cluster bacterium Io17-Chloro-G3]|nr:MAG: TlyA family rRNA (cytidine-2'-O)-methyltransferase [SAR202 cluster bacterium Io17-Chloro-G3]